MIPAVDSGLAATAADDRVAATTTDDQASDGVPVGSRPPPNFLPPPFIFPIALSLSSAQLDDDWTVPLPFGFWAV